MCVVIVCGVRCSLLFSSSVLLLMWLVVLVFCRVCCSSGRRVMDVVVMLGFWMDWVEYLGWVWC